MIKTFILLKLQNDKRLDSKRNKGASKEKRVWPFTVYRVFFYNKYKKIKNYDILLKFF